MKKLIIITMCFLSSTAVNAAMISSDQINNDPVKEKLCVKRAKGKQVAFKIDSGYVESARTLDPATTFIAIDGISPQLVECAVNQGTGKFGPVMSSPQDSWWQVQKPEQFSPGINTAQGREQAANTCILTAREKIKKQDYSHSNYSRLVEINKDSPYYHPGVVIAGQKAKRYDIVVEGTSFYKSSGIDLVAVNFTCLLSPKAEVKALRIK